MVRFEWVAHDGRVHAGRVGVPRKLIPAIAALMISAGLDGVVAVRAGLGVGGLRNAVPGSLLFTVKAAVLIGVIVRAGWARRGAGALAGFYVVGAALWAAALAIAPHVATWVIGLFVVDAFLGLYLPWCVVQADVTRWFAGADRG